MSRTGLVVRALVLAALVVVVSPGAASAIGLDGAAEATRRWSVSVGAGADRVSGYGQNTYPFAELGAAAEAAVWKRLTVGASASVRWDIADRDDALGRWRGGQGAAVAAQLFVGYDGPRFHLSVGPWLYGSGRRRPEFRTSVLPYGVVRLRVGHLDRWHVTLHVADGTPFTAEGGALGARLLLGAPVWGRHRLKAGVYTTLGEKTAGLAASDEIAALGPWGTALRLGGLLGTDLEKPGTRPELTVFAGLVW